MSFTTFFTPALPSANEVSCKEPNIGHWKRRLHGAYIDDLEDNVFEPYLNKNQLGLRLTALLERLLYKSNTSLEKSVCDVVVQHVEKEVAGFGPIDNLMNDPQVTDILINGAHDIWFEAEGKLSKSALQFDDNEHLYRFLDRLISHQGKFLDAKNPIVDARLNDGSRIHAVIPPLSRVGPVVSIRRFHKRRLTSQHLIQSGFVNTLLWDVISASVKARLNIVICGGAGVGKTSLLNLMASVIPDDQRVVTVEESAELDLSHAHVVSLEERATNSDGKGSISMRDLVRAALRMRADRIIVGESRGGEVLDMLQAMSCGHEGSLTTLHANSAQDVISRMETLSQMHEKPLQSRTVGQLIHSSIDLIIHLKKRHNGQRLVSNISLIAKENGTTSVVDVFTFKDQLQTHQAPTNYEVSNHINCLINKIESKGVDSTQIRQQLLQGNH